MPRRKSYDPDTRLPIYHQKNYSERDAYRIYPIFKLYAEWSDEIQPVIYDRMERAIRRNLIKHSDLLKFDTLPDAKPIRCRWYDRYIFKRLQRYARCLPIPPFQPDFTIRKGCLFPDYDEGTVPLRHLETWYDACHEMFETGSVLFQMLLVNGTSWAGIRSAIILFGRIIYYESFELELTESGVYFDHFNVVTTLQEHGFRVLILLIKVYAQNWIDSQGGWITMDFDNLQEEQHPLKLCVSPHTQELYKRPWLLRPEGLRRKLLSEIVLDSKEKSVIKDSL